MENPRISEFMKMGGHLYAKKYDDGYDNIFVNGYTSILNIHDIFIRGSGITWFMFCDPSSLLEGMIWWFEIGMCQQAD